MSNISHVLRQNKLYFFILRSNILAATKKVTYKGHKLKTR